MINTEIKIRAEICLINLLHVSLLTYYVYQQYNHPIRYAVDNNLFIYLFPPTHGIHAYIRIHACDAESVRSIHDNSSLVRALADDVARRVVVAGDEDAGVVVADDAGAADAGGVAPHHLRVVPTHLPVRAAVGVVVVVLLLGDPGADGVGRRPVGAGGAPEDVLPIGPAGVLETAVAGPLSGVALRELLQLRAPGHRANADGGTGVVVGSEVVLRRVLSVGRVHGSGGSHGQRYEQDSELVGWLHSRSCYLEAAGICVCDLVACVLWKIYCKYVGVFIVGEACGFSTVCLEKNAPIAHLPKWPAC